MLTTSDRQPFYCQNTFYKQLISVYKFKILQKISRPTLAQSLDPPQREEATNRPNSDIRTLNKIFKVYPWYPKIFQAIVSQEIPNTR